MAQLHHACHIRAIGYYVQDVRYAVGAGMRRNGHLQAGFPDTQAQSQPDTFHGVFAPNSKHRAQVTPARRGKVKNPRSLDENQTSAEKRASMTWAKRLKRVFNIDIETCNECGGDIKIIASIEDPNVIRKILAHLDEKVTPTATGLLPESRALPATGLFA